MTNEIDHYPKALLMARRGRKERHDVLNVLYGMRARFQSALKEQSDDLDLFDHGPTIEGFEDLWEDGRHAVSQGRDDQAAFYRKTSRTIDLIEVLRPPQP
jgi:hypothetical protein